MINRRQLLASGMAIVGGAIVQAPFAASAKVLEDKTLVANISPEPSALAVIATVPNDVVNANIADGLVTYDENFKPVPQLAKSWSVSSDGLTITFNLRDDVTWHDGKPFTSADVAYSINEVVRKTNAIGAAAYATVTGIETPDAHTVVLKLSSAAPALWSYLDSVSTRIVPKHIYEGSDPLVNPANNAPIGTGPFMFKEWVRGSHITYVRNPNYWQKDRPYLDQIIFKIIPDAGAREAALEVGEIQYAGASAVTLAVAKRLKENSKDLIVDLKGWASASKVFFFDFNLKRKVFQDVRVRRAFAHAIDRQALSKIVFQGFATPSHGPIPQYQPFYNPNAPDYDFSPAKAEALLDEAGLPRGADGVRLRINHVNHSFGEEYKLSGDLFKQQLKKVGVEVELVNYDTATQLKKVFTDRDFDTLSVDYAPFPDPQLGVLRRYWSKSIQDGVPWSNATTYSSPEMDSVIQGIVTEADPAKRKAYIDKLQVIAQTDLPSISLVLISLFRVYSSSLEGVNVTPIGAKSALTDVRFKA